MGKTKTKPPTPECATGMPVEGPNQCEQRKFASVDLEAYMPLLEDADTPDEQKMELLSALYAIMASFVDLGFSLEVAACGKAQKEPDGAAQSLRDHVYSSHRDFIERFDAAAGSDANAAQKGVGV